MAHSSLKTGKRWNYGVNSEFMQAIKSPSSSDIYTLEKLGDGDAVVSKISGSTGIATWAMRVTLKPSFKSLALNNDESKLLVFQITCRYFARDQETPASSKFFNFNLSLLMINALLSD